jgi:uncharacterized protein YvpB
MKRRILIDNHPLDILDVPYLSQKDTEYCCVIYSVMMVLEYYRLHFKDKPQLKIPDYSKTELIKILSTDPYQGTDLTEQKIARLNKKCPYLNLCLKETSLSEIERNLAHEKPVIAIYNLGILLYGLEAGGHAGVVIGTNDDYLILNNPSGGEYFTVEKELFSRAWENQYNWGLFIEPKSQMEVTGYAGSSD